MPPPINDLGRRILSSLVLIPLAGAAVWLGAVWFTLFIALLAAIMVWEWEHIVDPAVTLSGWLPPSLLAVLAVLIAAYANPIYFIVLMFPPPWTFGDRPNLAWRVGGFLWISLPCMAFVYLRDLPHGGLEITVWLLLLVWATDIAAYIAGKGIGGPRLAPAISPKKTWAGLLGGVFGAALIGLAIGNMLQPSRWWQIALVSAMLAVIEQMGDLAESYAKRRFGAKDSSRLIPGHGGFLDRLDGMLVVAFAMALFCWGTGENLLLWR